MNSGRNSGCGWRFVQRFSCLGWVRNLMAVRVLTVQ
jgi:hypothetical protein